MYSYFGIDRSPFMHRDYARFCMSLPAELLHKRRLQIEMLEEYWPASSKIGGTFRLPRGMKRIWHSARYHIAEVLPRSLRPLVGVTWLNKMDVDCTRAKGWESFFPITRSLKDTGPFRSDAIVKAAERAIGGSRTDLAKIKAAQPVISRLLSEIS
jgi:hypothetical protein